MRTLTRAISFAALLAGILVAPAEADTFNFSFSLDRANCNYGLNACSSVVNGSGTFTANYVDITFPGLADEGKGYEVQGLTGTLNGNPMTFVSPPSFVDSYNGITYSRLGAFLYVGPNGSVSGDGPNSCCFIEVSTGAASTNSIDFTAAGQLWHWTGNDYFGGWDWLTPDGKQEFVPIAWNITAVPEPSTLLLLGVGLLGLVGLVSMLPSRMDSK